MRYTKPIFTILIPTHDRPDTLLYALESLKKQTLQTFEVFFLADGASDAYADQLRKLAKTDRRYHLRTYPKHSSRGQDYWHLLLMNEAQGKYAAYLADDSLWFPQHLDTLAELLKDADFAHTLEVNVDGNGDFSGTLLDLGQANDRAHYLKHPQKISISAVSHSIARYRQLERGWQKKQNHSASEIDVWQEFLALKKCVVVSGQSVTSLQFPQSMRKKISLVDRAVELKHWLKTLQTASGQHAIAQMVSEELLRKAVGEIRSPRGLFGKK